MEQRVRYAIQFKDFGGTWRDSEDERHRNDNVNHLSGVAHAAAIKYRDSKHVRIVDCINNIVHAQLDHHGFEVNTDKCDPY
jgi:hypothetical protein